MSISYISLLRHHRANPAWAQQKASSSPTSRSLLSFLSGSLGIYGRAKGGSVSRRLMSTLGGESMIGKPFMRVVPELPSSLSGVVFDISCFDVCSRGPGGAWSLGVDCPYCVGGVRSSWACGWKVSFLTRQFVSCCRIILR